MEFDFGDPEIFEGDAKKNQGAVFHDNTLIFNDFAGRDDWI